MLSTIVTFKLLSLLAIGGITVISALLPLKFSHSESDPQKRDRILGLFSFFTGGVFLGAGLLHLLPDAVSVNPYADQTDFPVVYMLAAFGFIFVWSIEKIKLGDVQTPVPGGKMVAVTTAAATNSDGSGGGGGGSICYVRVEPVTTYNRFAHDTHSHSHSHNHSHSHSHSHGDENEHSHSPHGDGGIGSGIGGYQFDSALASSGGSGGGAFDSLMGGSITSAITGAGAVAGDEKEQLLGSATANGTGIGTGGGGGGGAKPQPASKPRSKSVIVASTSEHSHAHAHVCAADHNSAAKNHSGLHEDVCVGQPIYEHSARRSHATRAAAKPNADDCSDHSHARGAHSHGAGAAAEAASPAIATSRSTSRLPAASEAVKHAHSHGGGGGGGGSGGGGGHSELHDHRHDSVHHHHIVIPGNSILLPLVLAIIFSIHSFIEGLALGVQARLDNTAISVLIAILAHKCVEALTVSSNFIKENVQLSRAIPVILVYCCMTPLGIAVGMILNQYLTNESLLEMVMQGFASGSFLYLAIHEVSEERACHIVNSTHQVALVVCGLLFMSLIAVWA